MQVPSSVHLSTTSLPPRGTSPAPGVPGQVLEAPAAGQDGFRPILFELDARSLPELRDVRLCGSFNSQTGVHDPEWNGGRSVPMRDDGLEGDRVAGDRVHTARVSLREGQPQEFRWGATGDVVRPDGKVEPARWLVMAQTPPAFHLEDGDVQTHAPVKNHLFGVHREGADGIRFMTWSPEMGRGELEGYRLHVDLLDPQGNPTRSLPMDRDDSTGVWSLRRETGWAEMKGTPYQYSARDAEGRLLHTRQGAPVAYGDPWARFLQGPQRGVERIHVEPVLGFETGGWDDSGSGGPNFSDNPEWGRFTVDSHPSAERVRLVLKDESGQPLSKAQLLQRLGRPELIPYDQASPEDRRDVDVLRRWGHADSEPLMKYSWLDRVGEDGGIDLVRVDSKAGTAWVSAVNNYPRLIGLRYEFQVFEQGHLVGDANGDGRLQEAERRATPVNDPYTDVILPHPGSSRKSIIRQSTYQFRFDQVPRKQTDHRKFVVYEAHVGSFLSAPDNAVPATFEDVIANLDYLETLGVDSLELMPTQEFGSRRDWGYATGYYHAVTDAYGFAMERQQALDLKLIEPDEQPGAERVWVSGAEGLKLLVDEAHKRGLNVFADVVYNHVSGRTDVENPLGRIDGDKRSFVNWWGQGDSDTPWGLKPNFSAQEVKDFFSDNAAQQVQELGFDGIRFDFTQVLHDTGSPAQQLEGMETLRQINRTLQFLRPGVYAVAEDFSGNWLVAAGLDASEQQGPVLKKGMGFQGVWNDRFHDDLLAMAAGRADADRLMGALLYHEGVPAWDRGVIYAHSHDEVGNTGNWIARAAAGSNDQAAVQAAYPRAISGTASAMTLLGPGTPMLFQGEEFLANNDFKHGLTSTWGADLGWLDFQVTPDRADHFRTLAGLDRSRQEVERSRLDPREQELFDRYLGMGTDQRDEAHHLADQAGHFQRTRDLIALRRSSSAFSAAGSISRVYTHNLDRVLAFKRDQGGSQDEFVVISNFADQDRSGSQIPLPAGEWREVFNTNSRKYGGTGTGNGGQAVRAGSHLVLPAGSTIVLKKLS